MPTKQFLNVLIYSGPGTCEFSVKQTWKTLHKFLKSSYDVKLVGLDVLRNEKIKWDEGCALFVIPGGRDIPYLEEFKGTRIIERLWKLKYLGICAGAYFAADRIEFEIGREGYEIKGDRPFKLIKTAAIGTLNTGKPFKWSDTSFDIIDIKLTDESKEFKVAYNGGCHFPEAESDLILARYILNNSPAILLKPDAFCLSGVHFEYDPIDLERVELIKWEPERISLVKRILKGLGLQVNEVNEGIEELKSVKIYYDSSKRLNMPDQDGLEFIPADEDLRVLNSNFFTLYSKICTSTQTILLNNPDLLDQLPNYSIYLADHQIKGKGRSNNFWISSPACLQFTMKVEWPMKMSHRLPLLQFLMALTINETVNSSKFNEIEVKSAIKWPNDVYLKNSTGLIGKIAGILVNCVQSHLKGVTHVLIGVGINLLSDSSLPNLIHLNDHLTKKTSKQEFLSELLQRFKMRFEEFLESDLFPFQDYYNNWLHSNQLIETESEADRFETLRIKGIDEFGYLVAGKYKFEPDGNSFDMMNNLIKRKQ